MCCQLSSFLSYFGGVYGAGMVILHVESAAVPDSVAIAWRAWLVNCSWRPGAMGGGAGLGVGIGLPVGLGFA
jgi:hypothetical protein